MGKHDEEKNKDITVLLCDIRSAQNAGAIMRTAEAVGASEIVFGGYTPGPEDRFGRARKEFTKASLGAEHSLRWRFVKDYRKEIVVLKKNGAHIVAIEQSPRAVDYKTMTFPNCPVVIVLGNEVSGLPKKIISLADAIAEIPMKGRKESLNVSVAAGIVLYRFFDK